MYVCLYLCVEVRVRLVENFRGLPSSNLQMNSSKNTLEFNGTPLATSLQLAHMTSNFPQNILRCYFGEHLLYDAAVFVMLSDVQNTFKKYLEDKR